MTKRLLVLAAVLAAALAAQPINTAPSCQQTVVGSAALPTPCACPSAPGTMPLAQLGTQCYRASTATAYVCYGTVTGNRCAVPGDWATATGGASVIACVGTPGNTTGAPGQICKTTSGALYVCNAVSPASCAVAADWVNPAVPFLQNGTGAVTRTVQSKLTDGVSVKDFGATGVGSPTDDSSAIQAALTASSDVWFPCGTYYIGTTTLTALPTARIHMPECAYISYAGTGVALDINSGTNSSNGVGYVEFRGIRTVADWDPMTGSGTDTTSIGLRCRNCQGVEIHVRDSENFATGVQLLGDGGAGTVDNTIYIGKIVNNLKGLQNFSSAGGYTSNNSYIGGVIQISGGHTAQLTGSCYLCLPNSNNNANAFWGIDVEGATAQYSVQCGEGLDAFYSLRYEANVAGMVAVSGQYNRFFGGYVNSGGFFSIVTDTSALAGVYNTNSYISWRDYDIGAYQGFNIGTSPLTTNQFRIDTNGSASYPYRFYNASNAIAGIQANVQGSATQVGGITITGTPILGQIPTATSGTAATWQTPASVTLLQETIPIVDCLCAHGGDTTVVVLTAVQLAYVPTGATGGTGYTNGDTWTGTGGTCTTEPAGIITAASGPITALSVTTPGVCTVFPTGISQGAGTGSGAVILFSSCNNILDATATPVFTQFNSAYSVPANSIAIGSRFKVAGDFAIWSTATAEQISGPEIMYGTTNLTSMGGAVATEASLANRGFQTGWTATFTAIGTGTSVVIPNYSTQGLPGFSQISNYQGNASKTGLSTTGTLNLGIGIRYLMHGVASGTYTSGISATGATGTTCLLTAFNGTAGANATATIYLTGTNAIAGGTPLYITNTGTGYTAVSTSATVGNGTATCTGPATIVTVLGGAQGNMMNLNVGTWVKEH